MLAAALLQTIEDAGVGVLTLTEGLQDDELIASRLTRAEVTRQLRRLCDAVMGLPPEMRQEMPEVDWAGIQTAGEALAGPVSVALDEAMVFLSRALVPAALMWLRVYQQQNPQWFKLTPA